jgi:hypothetical protein
MAGVILVFFIFFAVYEKEAVFQGPKERQKAEIAPPPPSLRRGKLRKGAKSSKKLNRKTTVVWYPSVQKVSIVPSRRSEGLFTKS